MHALVLSPFVDRARFEAIRKELATTREGFDNGYEQGVSDMRYGTCAEVRSLAVLLPRPVLLDLVHRYLRADLGERAAERLWSQVCAMPTGDVCALFADLFAHAAERDL